MTPTETAALVAALIALFGALQAWLVANVADNKKAVKAHEVALDGLMTGRIATGAKAAIAADHQARVEVATPLGQADVAHPGALVKEPASPDSTP